ncbi:MAG: hypothetical protein JWM87_4231 [Candidatus Eremiobacteraeota bacterium]|nr:hypothetical protein [Candidatus Eremiobacteraeota bacterium]
MLAVGLALGVPVAATAQTAMTGSQQLSLLYSSLARMDSETRTLATMKNHISVRDIVTVPVSSTQLTTSGRRTLVRAVNGSRHTALEAALGKATVADVDRSNGQSEDQSSLAEYLQHRGIDPNNVIVVDIDPKQDRENPRVTVFYRR